MEINKKNFYSSYKNFGVLAFTLLFFAFSGCAERAIGKGPLLGEQGEMKAPDEGKNAEATEPAPKATKSVVATPTKNIEAIKKNEVTSAKAVEKAKPTESDGNLSGKGLVPVSKPAVEANAKMATPVKSLPPKGSGKVLSGGSIKHSGQAPIIESATASVAAVPPKAGGEKKAGNFKLQEIRVMDIPQTDLEDCLACGKSVKELRGMGLSEEEIKKAVKEKLDRLNKISRERRKEYDKKKEVDFSSIKDCVACGKTGKDLKAMGMTPEQIRAAYKEKFMKLKEQRERNLKSKKGQQLSEKIKEAYSRQKKNMAVQLKAEKDFIGLLEENLKNLREVAPPPEPSTFPVAPEGMVFVPAGKFLMGAEWGDDESAMPARLVHLNAFFIDKKEVNVAAYKIFMKKRFRGRVPFYLRDKDMGGDEQPAFKASWQDANDYCEGLEKRLPTEAEWEKSARGWDNRLFPWGNELPEKSGKYKANFNPGRKFEDGFLYTAPAGSFAEWNSPYGVMDLSGNVWEWTADWYDAQYYKVGPKDDPKGPEEGKEKVIRGGGFNTPLKRLLLTTRLKEQPKMRRGYLGFRCVKSVN